MADILTATPLAALGVAKIIIDLNQAWQVVNANPYFNVDTFIQGDFETNLTGWTGVNATVTQSTAQAHLGVGSAFVTPTGSGVVARVESTPANSLPATPGFSFTASAWVRPTNATKPAAVQITWRDAGGAFLSSSVATAPATAGAWQFLTVTANAPAGAAFAQPAAGIGSTPTVADTAYVDQLRLSTPANWMAVGGTVARTTAQAHEGGASLLFAPDGVSASPVARSENVPASIGEQFRASVWVRCDVARTVAVGITWRDSGGVVLSSSLNTISVAATTWTQIDTVAAAPAGAATAQLVVNMGGTPPTSNLLYIDEAKLIKLTTSDTPAVQSDDPVHIYRVTPDGAEHEIIGSPVRLAGGQAILYDTTAPFDTTLYYRAVIDTPTVLRDDFTRPATTNSWGTAPTGSTWTPDVATASPAANLTNGSQGIHRVAAVNNTYRSKANVVPVSNIDVKTSVVLSATPTGDYIRSNLHFRYLDALNGYLLQTRTFNGGAVQVFLTKVVGGAETTLASTTLPQPFFNPGTPMWLEAQADGIVLRARVWNEGQAVPDWQLVTTDSTYSSGDISISTFFSPANTNVLTYDVIYDGVRAYSLTPATIITNTTIQLAAGRDGWVRDPQNPALSVRLDNCAEHTFTCLNATNFVFFQGLEDEEFDSATGVFEVIDSENPITVAQTRKSTATTLRLVSTTLADIPRLKQLFSSGRNLSLSLPADYGWAIESYGTAPFTAGNVTAGRLNQRDMRKPQRRWSVPVRVVDTAETYPTLAPGGNDIPIPGATYQDFTDTTFTYDDLANLGATYLQWSQGQGM